MFLITIGSLLNSVAAEFDTATAENNLNVKLLQWLQETSIATIGISL